MQGPPKFHICYPSFPPCTSLTGLNHWCFPSNWPFSFTCFKSTVTYSALLPPPPAACSNCYGSGDTDGKVSLPAEPPAGLFSCRNVYHKIHQYFIFTQKCTKTPMEKKTTKKTLTCRIRGLCISSQVWNKFCHSPFPLGNDEPWLADTPQAVGCECHKYSWLLGCTVGSCKVTKIFLKLLLDFNVFWGIDLLLSMHCVWKRRNSGS